MGKDYVTFSKTKVNETRYLRVLPYSINAARDVLYQEPNSNNSYMFNPDNGETYFKHLGYGCYDLKKLYDLSDEFIKVEKDWLSTKESNAFIPDKILSLYKYATERYKTQKNIDIDFYKDKDQCKDCWGDQIRLFNSSKGGFTVVEYFTSNERTWNEFNTLKEAFTFITDLIKDHQNLFTEFRVNAEEDFYIENFTNSFIPNSRNHSDHLDWSSHPYSNLSKEEKLVIKSAAEKLMKEDFFLNAYYFQYARKRVQQRYNHSSDVDIKIMTERILAKTQKEAEDIFYKKYPRQSKINCALWESYSPLF